MTYVISIAEAAEDDIRQAYLWYEEQKKNLGTTFEKEFSKAVDSIKSNPLKAQIHYKEIRILWLKKFPFGIHFKVTGKNVLIMAVFHTALNPEKWQKR